jgi:hypothetical protein
MSGQAPYTSGFVNLTGLHDHDGNETVRLAEGFLRGLYRVVPPWFDLGENNWIVVIAEDGSVWIAFSESHLEKEEILRWLQSAGFHESPLEYHEFRQAVSSLLNAPVGEVFRAIKRTASKGAT